MFFMIIGSFLKDLDENYEQEVGISSDNQSVETNEKSNSNTVQVLLINTWKWYISLIYYNFCLYKLNVYLIHNYLLGVC